MRFTIAAVVAFAGLAFAALDIPDCAKSCFETAAEKAGCKSIEDTDCLCEADTQQKVGLDTDFSTCLGTAGCDADDLVKFNSETFANCETLTSNSTDSSSTSSSPSSSSTSSESDKDNGAAGTTIFGVAAFAAVLFAF